MRKYTAKNEKDLIQQIEADPELDKEWEKPVKGHVVEIKHDEENSNLVDAVKTKKSEATVA